MGLNATVYEDCEVGTVLATIRIGNLDQIAWLRARIQEIYPSASLVLTKVLYSAFHVGDSIEGEDLGRVRYELEQLHGRCTQDPGVCEFVMNLLRLVSVALEHDRAVTFT